MSGRRLVVPAELVDGQILFSLEHTFEPADGGLLRLVFNRFIRPRFLSDAMSRAWLRRSTPNHPSGGGG